MPSVTSRDGDYTNYKKSLDKLEREYEEQLRHLREKTEEHQAKLEENQKETLKKTEESTQSAVNQIRNDLADRVKKNREETQRDMEKAKGSGYDRYGKPLAVENELLRKQNQELANELLAQETSHVTQDRGTRRAEERRTQAQEERHQQELENVANQARLSLKEDRETAHRNQTEDFRELKREYDQKYADQNRRSTEEIAIERELAKRAVDQITQQAENKLKTGQEMDDERFKKLSQTYQEEALKTAQRNKIDRHKENSQLREQVKELLGHEKLYQKSKSQGLEDGIRYYETEWRQNQQAAADGFNKEIKALQEKSNEQTNYFSKLNDKNLKERDQYYTGLLNQQNQEHLLNEHELQNNYENSLNQHSELMKKQTKNFEQSQSRLLDRANTNRDEALKQQALAFQQTLNDQSDSQNSQIEQLQKELKVQKNTDDPGVISPAAERTIRKAVVNQYEKVLAAEKSSRSQEMDGLRDKYRDQLRDTQAQATDLLSSTQRRNASDRHLERSELLSSIRDSQIQHELSTNEQQKLFERERHIREKESAWALDRQRRLLNEIIEANQFESSAKIQNLRQDSQFQQKITHREFAYKHNEMVRNYERKLSDQKSHYEQQMAEIRNENQSKIRENDRKNNALLENQARAYEQRIAQLELSQKERERVLTQGYEEQVDKLKRSNALIHKKKS